MNLFGKKTWITDRELSHKEIAILKIYATALDIPMSGYFNGHIFLYPIEWRDLGFGFELRAKDAHCIHDMILTWREILNELKILVDESVRKSELDQ